MLHREDKQFNIGVQAREQVSVMPLTNSQMDESPSVRTAALAACRLAAVLNSIVDAHA